MKKPPYLFPTPSARIPKGWGLLEYKPRWGLTKVAWLILLLSVTLIGVITTARIHPFLSICEPIEAEVLIVEGWVDDLVLAGASAEFERGNYQLILTTGGSISKGSYLQPYQNFAELAAATLVALKIPPERVVAIPAPEVKTDRTAASALAVKKWLRQSKEKISGVNLYSYDVHTRRSWWLFKQILSPEIEVGAISHPTLNYDSKKWYRSSSGVRAIVSETIAYLYARWIWQAEEF